MNIGIFLPNWIGDVVMATPALRALRDRFPRGEYRLIGIQRPYIRDVLAGTPWLDEQLFYDPRAKDRELRAWPLVRSLRQRRLSKAVLFTNSLRSAAIAWAAGARERIGYVRYRRGPLLTHPLHHESVGNKWIPRSALDSYLRIAEAAGCEEQARHPRAKQMHLETLPEEEQAADALWHRLQLPPGNRVVVFNSGGAYGAAKHWPREYFAALARSILSQEPVSILVLCGPNEREAARHIVDLVGSPRCVSLADETTLSISLSKACVRRCRLMVSTDSGPRHFAAAFGVPVVSLFGPTHIAWSNTYHLTEVKLQHDVECGPCQKRVCPLGHHECMRQLAPDMVFHAVSRLLRQTQSAEAA